MPTTKKTTKKSKLVKKVTKTSKKPARKPASKKAPKQVTSPAVVSAPPVVAPAVPPPAPPVPSEAEKIWAEIQGRSIMMFGLPSQFVCQHCTVVNVEPSACYVTIRSSATLPSLEAAVAPDFTVELADKFVIIRRVPKPLIPSKKR